MVDCSQKLKMLREARHLTQLQVAERVGISKAMISTYKTASKAPFIEVLTRLPRIFGVTVDSLVCVDSPQGLDVSDLDEESIALLASLAIKLKSQAQE